jgi:hypothetical protein
MNSAKDSQNIWPREFDERLRLSRLGLLFNRSIHNLDPALSSSLFNLRDRCFNTLFTLRAWAKYREPS